jgi:anhydro-N-acetylmuramic acid kinase
MSADAVATAIGVISGTSMDGIDVALIRSDGEAQVAPGPGATYPYPDEVKRALRETITHPERAGEPLGDLERAVTDAHVDAVRAFLAQYSIDPAGIELVGLHGQTILHRPRERFTRQLCDGGRAASRLGLDVIADFRSADIAAGGQGAPLAPLYHAAISADLPRPLMVLNWGGVGNVTYLGADGEIVAFDTGPANAPLDDFIARRRGVPHDEGGELAASGRVDRGMVEGFMRDPYFALPAPKSLDRNHFHALAQVVDSLGDADGAATLAAFTVEASAAALRHVGPTPARWLVCGGGRRNLALMRALADRLAVSVEPIEAIGYDGDVIEAQCFAYLALRSRRGLAISLPTTTGVPAPLTGGVFWPANK